MAPDVGVREVVVALDIGGTRVKAALVASDLSVLASSAEPTPPDIGTVLGDVVESTTRRLVADLRLQGGEVSLVGCGVVVPGLVDDVAGVGVLSVNLGWRDLQIRTAVESRMEVPTSVGHDVRSGLVAEARLGAARGATDALFVPVGTGIAGALMLDGSVVAAGGWAGELGHVVVDPQGPECPCGGRGCLETIASASAIAREYAVRSGRAVDAEEVARLAGDGDPVATAVWGRAVAALADAIVTTVTITGVDLVMMGGGLTQSGEALLAPLRAEIAARLTFQRPPRLVPAALGDRAGCLGAACLAWDAR
ncbi:MAG: ROK family protein [Actinomycetota bacterium]|nr:ROK family protein [Actinomycetota bacterium]